MRRHSHKSYRTLSTAHLWTKSASISYFQSTLLFLLDKTFPSSDIKVGPKSFVRGHILLSAAVLHVQYWLKRPGELYFQTAYKKTFQVMFTLTDTKLYKKKCTRGSRGTRLKRPKGPQKLRWDSHDKRPPAAVQTVLFYMVSKVLPQRRCAPCEVEPTKRGGKKEKETLITFSTTPSFSVWENIKAATLWHVALLFSASLSLSPDGAPEIMPQIEEDTQNYVVGTFYLTKARHWELGRQKGGTPGCERVCYVWCFSFPSLICSFNNLSVVKIHVEFKYLNTAEWACARSAQSTE